MKLYTIYSESHEDFFINYFKKTIPNEFELIVKKVPQINNSGVYYSDLNWNKITLEKIKLFKQACIDNMGEIFIFSDVDIQFFGNIKDDLIKELGDFDIACQNDTGNYYCSGFFICRANERILKMFEKMIDIHKKDKNIRGDQKTLNECIYMVKSKFLSKKFFTIGHVNGGKVWDGENFKLPHSILIHHANWTLKDNKIKLLELVKKKMSEYNKKIQ